MIDNSKYEEMINEIVNMIVLKYSEEESLYLIDCMDSDPRDLILDTLTERFGISNDYFDVDDYPPIHCDCNECMRINP